MEAWVWLKDNNSVLGVLANLAILGVWTIYLQLFLSSYRRQRRCKILISLGGGEDLGTRCLISNMSAEPIYVARLAARVVAGESASERSVTDYRAGADGPSGHREHHTRQGPLLQGQWQDLGSVEDLLRQARDVPGDGWPLDWSEDGETPTELELTVVAIYGSDDLPVGARRRFRFEHVSDGWRVNPATATTVQFRSKRSRRKLREM